jgi:hypothetical protein
LTDRFAVPAASKYFVAVLLAVGLLAGTGACQEAGGDTPHADAPVHNSEEDKPAVPALTLLKGDKSAEAPDVFFLPDAAGKLRRILGYRYEDFLKAWQGSGSRQSELDRPKYVLTELAGTLKANGDAVRANFTIDVDLESDEWAKVPLKLASLIVDEAKVERESNEFVAYDSAIHGYAAWLQGKPGEKRRIALSGAFAVSRDGDEKQLELDAPAAAKSSIDFIAETAAEVDGSTKALVSSSAASKDQVTTRIDGLKQPVTLRWGPQAELRETEARAFEATTDVTINVDPGRLSYDALVSLKALGKPIDHVRIKLPPGSSASAPSGNDAYELSTIRDDKSAGTIVEIRFNAPSKNPTIQLSIRLAPAVAETPTTMQAAPVEVLDAFRQRGSLAVRVNEQLHAHFEPHGRVEQIDVADLPEDLRGRNYLAAFSTAGSNWTLGIHTQRRQRKIRVTPTYGMQLGGQGALLDVALDYQIAGGHTFDLRINLHGWELTEQPIESGGVVDLVEQHVTSEQVLIMPLKDANVQQVRVKFSLRREAGLGAHELPLPEILDATVLPGTLSVTTDDAWRATAEIDKCVGIALAPPAPREKPAETSAAAEPVKPRTSLSLQTFLPQARLAVEVAEREQLITVKSNVIGRIEGNALKAEQRLDYDIAFQPASELGLTVSTELLANEGLELLLDGKPLAPSAVDILPSAASAEGQGDGSLRLVVRLAQPSQGKLTFNIRTAIPLNAANLTGKTNVSIPLAQPDQSATTTASISAPAGTAHISIASGEEADSWTIEPPAPLPSIQTPSNAAIFSAASAKPVKELLLRLNAPSSSGTRELSVESTWAQTWVAGGERQDRIVYRLVTDARKLELELPSDFGGAAVEATVNGTATPTQRINDTSLAIELPASEGSRAVVLELRRRAAQPLLSWSELMAGFPTIHESSSPSPFIWQLVLPAPYAALGTPPGFSAEYTLGWADGFWGRHPTQTQADLEHWTGAAARPAPSPALNQYVFTAFDMPTEVQITVVERVWMIMLGGLAALAVGLALLYTNVARSGAFWLALCIAAAVLLITYPEAAIGLVQAVLIGAAFTLVSTLTRWLLADGEPAPMPAQAAVPASSIASLAATQAWIADDGPEAGHSGASTGRYQASGAAP